MGKSALISGASGLVGGSLLKLILNNEAYSKVYILVRKSINIQNEKLEELLFDYENQEAYAKLPAVDTTFCCLGTTIKVAGSQEAFKKVDFHYPLSLAKASLNNKSSSFHVITALGADAQSNFFYNKVKGELEDVLKKLNFDQLYIYQPSLLLGNRKDSRIGEKIGALFMTSFEFVMQGNLKKYRAIKVEDVAKGMLYTSLKDNTKIKTILSDEIQALANRYTDNRY